MMSNCDIHGVVGLSGCNVMQTHEHSNNDVFNDSSAAPAK